VRAKRAPLGTPRTASRIRGSGCRRRAGARLLLAGDNTFEDGLGVHRLVRLQPRRRAGSRLPWRREQEAAAGGCDLFLYSHHLLHRLMRLQPRRRAGARLSWRREQEATPGGPALDFGRSADHEEDTAGPAAARPLSQSGVAQRSRPREARGK